MVSKPDWEDPYYEYLLPSREIKIDVTASIPRFDKEVDALSDTESEFRHREFSRILDFGAGKLRNTLYLLRQRNKGRRLYKVWAVEFKEAFERPAAQEKYQEASKNKGFFFLEYPKDFLEFREELDAVLLINVLNIVPDKGDRKRILTECARRVRRGGLMLLMCQYGEPNYGPGMTRRLKLTDGWCYNLHKRFQTFNREYTIPQLRAEVPADLFKEFRQLSSAHHRAFLFERI